MGVMDALRGFVEKHVVAPMPEREESSANQRDLAELAEQSRNNKMKLALGGIPTDDDTHISDDAMKAIREGRAEIVNGRIVPKD